MGEISDYITGQMQAGRYGCGRVSDKAQTYSQLKRTGKVHETEYAQAFQHISRAPGRYFKKYNTNIGPYRQIMCNIVKIDEGWHEYDEDWRHYWCDDEHAPEPIKVIMQADEATLGWYVLRVHWVGNPERLKGNVVEKIEQ